MPDPRTVQSDGEEFNFFANTGDGDLLSGIDHTLAGAMNHEQTELMYGECAVSPETFKFLKALESQLGRDWLGENLGTGKEKIRLNEKGGIYYFNCSYTQITTLPELPAGLRHLSCSGTQIITLPEIPTGMQYLNCSFTQITTLPELPAGLESLECSFTQITTLPELPAGLEELYCENTPLSKDPVKRANLEAECEARGITLTI